MVHADVVAGVKLDLDALRVAGDETVLQIAEVAVQTDDIQPDIRKHRHIIRGGSQVLEHIGIGVRGHHKSQLMGLSHKIGKFADNLLLWLVHRQQTGKDTAEPILCCQLHVLMILLRCGVLRVYGNS